MPRFDMKFSSYTPLRPAESFGYTEEENALFDLEIRKWEIFNRSVSLSNHDLMIINDLEQNANSTAESIILWDDLTRCAKWYEEQEKAIENYKQKRITKAYIKIKELKKAKK